ncbi:MAG: metal ABC transporter permease [Actinobacteria bacterium]|jgi:ABC-type Mn2+/Zn2+ transport system permease subunit|nr:metal ABC transporter permease [Actinomycetota bacterium]
MIHWFLDPFQSDFSQRAGLVCLMVGLLAPVVGTWISLRRLAYMGDAMSHSLLGGVAIGFAWFGSAAVLPGALVAGIFMAITIHLLSQNRRIAHDSIIAVVGSGMFAFGVLALSKVDTSVSLTHFLFGQLLTVNTVDLWITVVLTVASLFFVWFKFDDLKFATFDRDHATQLGIRVQRLDAAMLILLAVCVVVCLSTVGTVLTVSLLITPAATSRLFFNRVDAITFGAIAVGLTEVVLGFIISYHANMAPGPTITLLTTAVFIAAYIAQFATSDRTYVHHTHEHDHH